MPAGASVPLTFALLPDLKASQNLSFSEDSDLSFDDVLERSSQKSKPSVSSGEVPPLVSAGMRRAWGGGMGGAPHSIRSHYFSSLFYVFVLISFSS